MCSRDWSSDVCSSDLRALQPAARGRLRPDPGGGGGRRARAARLSTAFMAVPVAMPKLGMTMREGRVVAWPRPVGAPVDRKSTRLNSSHGYISYAVFCL